MAIDATMVQSLLYPNRLKKCMVKIKGKLRHVAFGPEKSNAGIAGIMPV